MDTVIIVLAILAGLVGIAGSIIPALPGPPAGWLGMLLIYLWGSGTDAAGDPMSGKLLFIMLGVVTLVTVLDYIVPGYFTKKSGGSRAGATGAIIGVFFGMFFLPPWGILVGCMAGAFIGEIVFASRTTEDAVRSAVGAFAGFLFGTIIKIAASCVILYYIITYAF